ncbi:MAG: flagellar hook-basal body complex protein FliE [Spirochaetota bacterium]
MDISRTTAWIDIAKGHNVNMKVDDSLHMDDSAKKPVNDDVTGSFKGMLLETIGKVNNLQVESNELYQKMIYEPESVDVHQVMVAQQKAEVSLAMTKSVRDGVIQAYKELTNLR